MASDAEGQDDKSLSGRRGSGLDPGPFVLRTLLERVPLSPDGETDEIKITCVDYLDGNLYVGTSASELLHFVQIPSGPEEGSASAPFIIASRLKPAFSESPATATGSKPGVQQILLLPRVGKACILCNWTVTFYSLPELSPVFGSTQVKNCNWIGGIDLNEQDRDVARVPILLSLNRRIQVVRIGDDARGIKNIDFAASTLSVRRGSIACVADSRSYALLEIERQLKIPLMSISSLDSAQPGNVLGQAQDISGSDGGGILRSASSAAQNRPPSAGNNTRQGHRRGTSLGNFISAASRRGEARPGDGDESVHQEASTPDSPQSTEQASTHGVASDTPSLETAGGMPAQRVEAPASRPKQAFLKPHILSPTPEEFLLVTGTGPLEPGIGIFVNLDGDPTRPTIEFDRYPKEIAVDGGGADMPSSHRSHGGEVAGYVLASMGRDFDDGIHNGLEIQRWDSGAASERDKYWLEAPAEGVATHSRSLGIRSLVGADTIHFHEIVDRLCQEEYAPRHDGGGSNLDLETDGGQSNRRVQEAEFAKGLAGSTARIVVWTEDRIWWAVRNPLILRLDAQLEAAVAAKDDKVTAWRKLSAVSNSFRGQDATSELEFLTFNYIRQRAGLLLLTSFLESQDDPLGESELGALQEVLVDSLLDPRVVLSLIPGVRDEVIVSAKGIWIFGGVKRAAEDCVATRALDKVGASVSHLPPHILKFLKGFLTAWRSKKGFGSIQDENVVFRSVDAALLAVLLEMDKQSPPGLAKARSIRTELYELVDSGLDCFERAVSLVESYHRLFVLSRLYQSRKMPADVLATWRRILEGERDDGAELRDGEQRVRAYLANISSQALVQEYGLWLANRDPKLGVQVFADDKGRAPKFEPAYVVGLLREKAPEAVVLYLEHLVFDKGHTIYVDELITHYLGIVIDYVQSSAEAREMLLSTYAAYRALRPPKPTYRQFLADNAPAGDDLWQSRLRLLQLLGGTYEYDSAAIRERIASLSSTAEDLLVPETIILDGRERRHEDALRLLVHRLGDYDTAVAYCIRGGACIYSIYQAVMPAASAEAKARSRRGSMPPTQEQQTRLFRALLGEFLVLEDVSDRVEQTAMLLDRFGGWYDVDEVLAMIPNDWSVHLVYGFLVKALRRLMVEKTETTVVRALSSSQYLQVQHDLVVRIDEKGPTLEEA